MIQSRFQMFLVVLLSLLGCVGVTSAREKLRLSGIFGDHMILQRDRPVSVWGWAEKGDRVQVEFGGLTRTTSAGESGAWQITLKSMKANGTGRELFVRCNDESVRVRDILVGDVWHASGQSNMAMTMGAVARRLPQAKKDIAAAVLPSIRFRRITEKASANPLDNLPTGTGWKPCSPDTVVVYSAVAFYFAQRLHDKLGVPIGVIDSSRGGTPIEPFVPLAAFTAHPTLRKELALADQGDLRGLWKLPGGVRARDENWLPGRLFHSRIAPIARFAVRGAIWYQGESNCGNGEDPRDYQHKMRALFTGWRTALGNAKLPFYFVQLPGSGARAGWPYLREQQRLSSVLPFTGMVVTIDLLDKDIHPPNKFDVGERLARWALAQEYRKTIPYSGPQYQRVEIDKGVVTVHFTHTEPGLMVAVKEGRKPPTETRQKKLSHFELADQSGRWHPAEASINGQTVVVHRLDLTNPIAVRYGYAIDPQNCHLYNRHGLPASPFCSRPKLLRYEPVLPKE